MIWTHEVGALSHIKLKKRQRQPAQKPPAEMFYIECCLTEIAGYGLTPLQVIRLIIH